VKIVPNGKKEYIIRKGGKEMVFNDFREFIDKLDKEGQLVRIKQEVDWNLEAGAIIRNVRRHRMGQVLYSRTLKAIPKGSD